MKLSVFFGIFIRIGTDTEMLLVPIQLGRKNVFLEQYYSEHPELFEIINLGGSRLHHINCLALITSNIANQLNVF